MKRGTEFGNWIEKTAFLLPTVAMVLVAGVLSGCGMLRHPRVEGQPGLLQAPPADEEGRIAERLNLRLVRAGKDDPEIPDRAFNLRDARKGDEAIIEGDQIQFRGVVYLQGAQLGPAPAGPLFLVMDERALGHAIQDVTAEHRVENERNTIEGQVSKVQARFDLPSRRWYLPVSELISEDGSAEHAGRQHVVQLDLHLEDGTRHLVTVRFRAVGPMPRLVIHRTEATEARTPLQVTRELSRGELELQRVRISNPGGRRLSLWVQAPREAEVSGRYVVQRETWFQKGDPKDLAIGECVRPPVEARRERLRQDQKIRISSIIVSRAEGPDARVELAPSGAWAKVDLAAREQVVIRWMGGLAHPAYSCELAVPIFHAFAWCEWDSQGIYRGIRVSRTDSQELESFLWKGRWKLPLRVSDFWEDPAQGLSLDIEQAGFENVAGAATAWNASDSLPSLGCGP